MYSCNELNVMIFANKFNHDQVRFRGVFSRSIYLLKVSFDQKIEAKVNLEIKIGNITLNFTFN